VILIKSSKKYEYLSNAVLGIFLLLIACAALLTDIFHTPIKSSIEVSGMSTLFKANDLNPIIKISLKNKSGNYIFEKLEKNQISPWHMTFPRNVTANSIFIEKLFTSLTSIKVKNIFPNDQINNSNFSLEKPNASITLEGPGPAKIIKLDIGLLNTIDNTTYIKISAKNNIYQVEVPSVSIENATILDLIESKIFSIDLESINSFKVTFNKKSADAINIHKKNTGWANSDETLLAQDKVEEYFQDLSTIKSSFVLDSQTAQQKKQIMTLTRTPEITLTANDNNKNIITYRISSLLSSFPEIDLKNGPYFLVTISNNQTAYIVKKEFLDLFNKKF
jgi:hypothetical protein